MHIKSRSRIEVLEKPCKKKHTIKKQQAHSILSSIVHQHTRIHLFQHLIPSSTKQSNKKLPNPNCQAARSIILLSKTPIQQRLRWRGLHVGGQRTTQGASASSRTISVVRSTFHTKLGRRHLKVSTGARFLRDQGTWMARWFNHRRKGLIQRSL